MSDTAPPTLNYYNVIIAIVKIASVCLMLQELDVSGCLGVSSECLTQLLHLILSRDKSKAFDLLAGGSTVLSTSLKFPFVF